MPADFDPIYLIWVLVGRFGGDDREAVYLLCLHRVVSQPNQPPAEAAKDRSDRESVLVACAANAVSPTAAIICLNSPP